MTQTINTPGVIATEYWLDYDFYLSICFIIFFLCGMLVNFQQLIAFLINVDTFGKFQADFIDIKYWTPVDFFKPMDAEPSMTDTDVARERTFKITSAILWTLELFLGPRRLQMIFDFLYALYFGYKKNFVVANWFYASLIVDITFQFLVFISKPELDTPHIPLMYRLIYGFDSLYITGEDIVTSTFRAEARN